jgi:hypothetical protein
MAPGSIVDGLAGARLAASMHGASWIIYLLYVALLRS